MEDLNRIVNKVLEQLATSKRIAIDSDVNLIVSDSLDQVRLLVALEEALETDFDEAIMKPFNLDSRADLIASIEEMLSSTNVVIEE
ncbi:hypothetical protein [Chitinibacter sp. ZOR0017]|uniref:hypothetical protein n=1 Tax=Chitinibacter sp. ZOR0017 TaxID=1339254 RepID=UPI000645DA68|nr:hypothetical protein [Chitinibacter sp. ZOR0017]